MAAAGDSDIKEKLLNGTKAGTQTYKVHLDGYNLLPMLTGQGGEWPRNGFFYWSDDGDLVAMRYDRWKLVFMEQRARQFGVWMEPFVKLRIPLVFDLRMDPFERASENANAYYEWMEAMVQFVGVPSQVIASKMIASFKDYECADREFYIGKYHNLDDENGNIIILRSAVPFKTGSLKHIARATLPIVTNNPSGKNGLGDLVLFDLLAFDKSWGRWGAELVGMAPTASDDQLGAGKWAVGPAFGFVASGQKLMWRVFNQNLFSFAGDDDRQDVKVSILQPIINFSLPNKWSIGVSEMNITYDWEKSAWTSLPLGMKINKLVNFGKLPVMFSGAYEYNFQADYVAPEWTVNFTLKILFPI